MRRRELLAGIAVSPLLARRAFGAGQRLGLGVIGAGNRGTEVTKALLASGGCDLVAIADVFDERRDKLRAAAAPGKDVFSTVAHEELLARQDVDAVLIAAPDHLHLDLARAAFAAKKHVYLEKPSTHALAEGATLIAAARASGRVCQTGTQQRSGAHYLRAKHEVFAERRLGHVVFARAVWADFPRQRRRFDPAPKPAGLDWNRFLGRAAKVPYHPMRYETWRYYPEYGGGVLADILTHWADVAQWMLDDDRPIAAVAAGGVYELDDGRENPDVVNAIVQYRNWNLTFESSVLPIKVRPSVLFEGTEGSLDIGRDGYTFTPREGAPEVVKAEGNLDEAHAREFVAAIKEGRRPSADVEIGVAACRPVHLALAAYAKRRRAAFASDGKHIV
jgi:predicted dehydrogenase